jgi:hypothetical protein
MHIIYFHTSVNYTNSVYSVNSLLSITSILKYSVMPCTGSAIICGLLTYIVFLMYLEEQLKSWKT